MRSSRSPKCATTGATAASRSFSTASAGRTWRPPSAAVEDVTHVATQGIDRREADTILSLLALAFEPGEDGTGRLILTLAGDGAVALDVEALEVTLQDVTRPYIAPSKARPTHPE